MLTSEGGGECGDDPAADPRRRAPAKYYRALRDVAAWMPKNAFLSADGAGTMDIGLAPVAELPRRSCLNLVIVWRHGVSDLLGRDVELDDLQILGDARRLAEPLDWADDPGDERTGFGER